MFNLTKFIEALNNMGVKVLLAIAKGELEEIKERKLI